jgi:hypothetical protein
VGLLLPRLKAASARKSGVHIYLEDINRVMHTVHKIDQK